MLIQPSQHCYKKNIISLKAEFVTCYQHNFLISQDGRRTYLYNLIAIIIQDPLQSACFNSTYRLHILSSKWKRILPLLIFKTPISITKRAFRCKVLGGGKGTGCDRLQNAIKVYKVEEITTTQTESVTINADIPIPTCKFIALTNLLSLSWIMRMMIIIHLLHLLWDVFTIEMWYTITL